MAHQGRGVARRGWRARQYVLAGKLCHHTHAEERPAAVIRIGGGPGRRFSDEGVRRVMARPTARVSLAQMMM
jgi:hypothetical protein